jgi:hypothetical protein
LGEYGSLLPGRDKRKRQGKYHGSEFYNIVVDYGVKKWVVGVYIDVDYNQYINEMSEEEVVKRCIEYLNQPPPRKKYQKKKPQPLYGNLDSEALKYWTGEDSEGRYIGALLVTDQRKNKKFWGVGGQGRVKRKRGRPRKDEQ